MYEDSFHYHCHHNNRFVKELFFNRLCSLLISLSLNYSQLEALNNYLPIKTPSRVIKSSRLPAKIAIYLVSIGQLFCLAFLYGWCLAAYFDNSAVYLKTFWQPCPANFPSIVKDQGCHYRLGGRGFPMATSLGTVEPKELPSFDSLAILLAAFTQQLTILLTAWHIMILLFPTLNIILYKGYYT